MSNYLQKFKQQVVYASFEPTDRVFSGAFLYAVYDQPKRFLAHSTTSRVLEIAWRLLVTVLFGFGVVLFPIALVAVTADIKESIIKNSGLAVFSFAMSLFCLYQFLLSQGFLRWMIKNFTHHKS